MGQRVIQRIYTCDECGVIPTEGESLWEMYENGLRLHICQICMDEREKPTEGREDER